MMLILALLKMYEASGKVLKATTYSLCPLVFKNSKRKHEHLLTGLFTFGIV